MPPSSTEKAWEVHALTGIMILALVGFLGYLVSLDGFMTWPGRIFVGLVLVPTCFFTRLMAFAEADSQGRISWLAKFRSQRNQNGNKNRGEPNPESLDDAKPSS